MIPNFTLFVQMLPNASLTAALYHPPCAVIIALSLKFATLDIIKAISPLVVKRNYYLKQ